MFVKERAIEVSSSSKPGCARESRVRSRLFRVSSPWIDRGEPTRAKRDAVKVWRASKVLNALATGFPRSRGRLEIPAVVVDGSPTDRRSSNCEEPSASEATRRGSMVRSETGFLDSVPRCGSIGRRGSRVPCRSRGDRRVTGKPRVKAADAEGRKWSRNRLSKKGLVGAVRGSVDEGAGDQTPSSTAK